MGRHKVKQDTAYSQYADKGGRVIAVRIPPEINRELELRTKKRGLTMTSYVKTALYWYMRNEALFEDRINQLVDRYEYPVGTVES